MQQCSASCIVPSNYFESGQGKGHCDSISGSVKCSGDRAIKKSEVIQGTDNSYQWDLRQEESAVTYLLVREKEVDEATAKLEKLGRFPIPGTMKMQSIRSALYTQETSCFVVVSE